jgi:hypothetical protein
MSLTCVVRLVRTLGGMVFNLQALVCNNKCLSLSLRPFLTSLMYVVMLLYGCCPAGAGIQQRLPQPAQRSGACSSAAAAVSHPAAAGGCG